MKRTMYRQMSSTLIKQQVRKREKKTEIEILKLVTSLVKLECNPKRDHHHSFDHFNRDTNAEIVLF